MLSLLIFSLVQTQQSKDPYYDLLTAYNTQSASSFKLEVVHQAMFAAQSKGASAMTRFKFAALAVRAWDTTAFGYGSMLRYTKDAASLLTESELKLSPSYSYLVARLGVINSKVGKVEIEAAKLYYQARHSGASAYIYAQVLQKSPDDKVGASSLPYALEAQSKQPDSLNNRWLVAGAYLCRAFATDKKSDWEQAIKGYEKALELAKDKNQITSFENKIRASKRRLAKAKS